MSSSTKARSSTCFDNGTTRSHFGWSPALCSLFRIDDPSAARIAAIVHDLDLKDGRFGAPEAATIGAVIDGLQPAHADDDQLRTQGMTLFDALYRTFDRSARASGPRAVAPAQTRGTSRLARRRRR